MHVMWSTWLKPRDLEGKTPKGYIEAANGTDKAPGLYGEGFGGEALVCLLENDNGDWFEKLAKSLDPAASVKRS
jgi:hypothetical protein